jgi:hypothetical protein
LGLVARRLIGRADQCKTGLRLPCSDPRPVKSAG